MTMHKWRWLRGNASTISLSSIKHWSIGIFTGMPVGRKESLLPEQSIKGCWERTVTTCQKQTATDTTFCVNNKNGALLPDRQTATTRWQEYFEQIWMEEFAHPLIPQALPPLEHFRLSMPLSSRKQSNQIGESNRTWKHHIWKFWIQQWVLHEFFNRMIEAGTTPTDKKSWSFQYGQRKSGCIIYYEDFEALLTTVFGTFIKEVWTIPGLWRTLCIYFWI